VPSNAILNIMFEARTYPQVWYYSRIEDNLKSYKYHAIAVVPNKDLANTNTIFVFTEKGLLALTNIPYRGMHGSEPGDGTYEEI